VRPEAHDPRCRVGLRRDPLTQPHVRPNEPAIHASRCLRTDGNLAWNKVPWDERDHDMPLRCCCGSKRWLSTQRDTRRSKGDHERENEQRFHRPLLPCFRISDCPADGG
jgi:hypothetical protein